MNDIVKKYNSDEYDDIRFLIMLKDFRFKISNIGFKKDRLITNSKDPINIIINNLKEIPSISNKDILYNSDFVKIFYNIFWDLIQKIGIATQNFYDFIDVIVFELNRITTNNYVISDCHSTDKYNCGRAMIIIDKYPSKLLLFNTDEKGYMDTNTQLAYLNSSCLKETDINDINISDIENISDINILDKYYGNMANRVKKEINNLRKEFNVQLFLTKIGLKIILEQNKIKIILLLPFDYPLSSPSGIFNDMTISDIDFNWSSKNNLKNIVNSLIVKYNNQNFPKHNELLCFILNY